MDALSAAAALLPDLCVEPAGTLRRSDRSEVLRVRVSGPGWPGPDTLIVKLFPDAGESWARESAALAAMPAAAPVPRPIAASADPPAIVMTDAGSGPSALTLADACPDNSIRTTRGYLLIDFEEAEWRPVAWDVAYLTVPWPSCWCCFTLPPSVTRQAVARYRSAAAGQLPYLGTPAFGHDVGLATAGWALVSSSWFLGRALGEDQPFDSEIDEINGLPTRRAVIAHRLATAQRTEGLPALATLAARLRTELIKRWGGEPPLRPAPAFRPAPRAQPPRPASRTCRRLRLRP
jgi:hypothetical protein